MTKKKLETKEDLKLIKSAEKGKWEKTSFQDRKKLISAARVYLKRKKDKRITIRISQETLNNIQQMAMEEGIPYQTLISSVLYKYSKLKPAASHIE